MATKRNRIIYASQSVFIDGLQSNRVQTFNSTSTFRSEDIFELGQLELIDVVDDVPTVAITMDHNNVDSTILTAKLAGINFQTGRLTAGGTAFSGIALSDFARSSYDGAAMWSPVQDESKMGAVGDNTIEQTMFMDGCCVNRVEFGCTVGANATENYTLETDNKVWLLNAGKYVNYVEVSGGDFTELAAKGFEAVIASGVNICGISGQNALSQSKIGFLFKNDDLSPCIRVQISGMVGDTGAIYEIPVTSGLWDGAASTTTALAYPASGNSINEAIILRLPSGTVDSFNCVSFNNSDKFYMVYCADGFDTSINSSNIYFNETAASGQKGGLRQGQVEAYILDKGDSIATSPTWRLQGATITADLTREPINQLGNLRPYTRPVRLPIPITVTVDSLAADLEAFAMFAGEKTAFDAETLKDLDIDTLLRKKTLNFVAYIYHQSDVDAGGTHANRKWREDTTIFYEDGTSVTYTAGSREYPQKVIVITNIYPTDEAYNIDTRANATQRFGFAARNTLYVINTHDIDATSFTTLESNITSITKV
jgi:hypothetical protein